MVSGLWVRGHGCRKLSKVGPGWCLDGRGYGWIFLYIMPGTQEGAIYLSYYWHCHLKCILLDGMMRDMLDFFFFSLKVLLYNLFKYSFSFLAMSSF